MPTSCPACIERAKLEQDRLAVRSATRDIFQQQTLPPGLRGLSFESYSPNGNRRAYDRCLLYADTVGSGNGRGLALQGGVGTGKTHLGVSVARRVAGSYVINAVELLDDLRSSFAPGAIPTDTYRRCLRTPLLVLDDMGKQKPSDWVAERLYHLVNYRVEHLLPMIVTTNDAPDNWDNRWTEAVADRIRGACDLVLFTGLSHRRPKQ
jgi:DNA replication protein DnaC